MRLILKKYQGEELHNLGRSPNIVRVVKSRILRWALNVEGRSAFKILTGKPIGKRLLGSLDEDVDGRTCCPWSHGLRSKKLSVSVAVPPPPVRIPSQKSLAPSVASVANDGTIV